MATSRRGPHGPARGLAALLAAWFAATPVTAPAQDAPQRLDPVVVTATRSAERAFDVPASIDIIDAATLRDGQAQVNLSETLGRVPGVFAANRQNYAQDLQISSRGFGARATFGVRGVRLYQDGIPVTMPDGQGQTGSFSLLSAQRIEVLRGPFSTLYGNASGGVIAVFSEDGSAAPVATFQGSAGSYDSFTAGAKLSARSGAAGGVIAGSEFRTGGYRDHAAARRDLVNAKLDLALAPATRVVVVGNAQFQPETQDPLGLTRAQWSADPRQVDPSARQFDTRKTIGQVQGGLAVDHRIDDQWDVHAATYAGRRGVRQYLALSGAAIASSGGVTDLDRTFDGVGARLTWRGRVGDRPLSLIVGADTDRQREARRGYVNDNGSLGALRRDEDDTVRSTDVYAEAELALAPALSLRAGLRASEVRYRSDDHFVVTGNPDDSGSRRFRNTSPVAGVVFHASEDVNVYASYGEGFETPTFAELAYRPGGTGLNFGLEPAKSRAGEIGVKARFLKSQRLDVAAFVVRTENEIVTDAATGGRTTFKNAGRTRRHGAEAAWTGEFGAGLRAHVALTWLAAEFADAFATGAPPVTVAAGARLPGVPARQAYGELAWTPGGFGGFSAALEWQYVDKLYVNDRNSDAAPAYAIGSARAGFAQKLDRVTMREFVRVNNLTDRRYAGSVIVGDTNGRFFEPAPPRNWLMGLSVDVAL